jgi:hypothetical protein
LSGSSVGVRIGREHGTLGPQQVKEAATEAVQGVGFDMLIVCGFALDPHVAEEMKPVRGAADPFGAAVLSGRAGHGNERLDGVAYGTGDGRNSGERDGRLATSAARQLAGGFPDAR